ncbi:MAG: LamG-like jellyroll fold domain-containing protein [bacterium]|nr:LamG-like jellyroll fold domain-containing protein [bacterium]
MDHPNNKGFTLIELLVYTVIFSISVGVFSGVLITFTRVQTQTSADSELTQQLAFVQSTIQRLVRESANIENPAGVASSSLVLRMASSSLDPTIISSDANGIYLKQGTGAIAPLTNSQVKVSQFQATKYENPDAHAIVQINLALTYNSQNPYQQITRALKIAIGRVSAATFDDSLIPNADNSFSLGDATYKWKDVNISNLLNVGQLTIDPVAGAQNGSIYYNTASNAFRGYKSGSWADLGVGWAASSTNIYNTNAGKVGIGTANPGLKLDILGDNGLPATTGSTQTGSFRIGQGLNNGVMDFGYYGSGPTGWIQSTNRATLGAYHNLSLNPNGGNVGIGTASPGFMLDVAGLINASQGLQTTDSYNKLLLHMESSGTSFSDSATGKAVTAVGSATQTTAQYKLGSKSGLFNGTTDYLTVPDSADWAFGTGNFTIDTWVRFTGTLNDYAPIWSQYNDGANLIVIDGNTSPDLGKFRFLVVEGGVVKINVISDTAIVADTWYHIAVVRNGDNLKMYYNGIQVATGDFSASYSIPDFTGNWTIGWRGSIRYFNGYLDELRISKGIARWTSNFTPPAAPYGVITASDLNVGNVNASGNINWNASNMNPTNLLSNGNFENWSAGTSAAPDGWVFGGDAVSRESTTVKLGTYSAKMTGANFNGLYQLMGIAAYRGKTVTMGCWAWSNVADRLRVVAYEFGSGIADYSPYHTGDSTWQRLTVTHLVSNNGGSTNFGPYIFFGAGTTVTAYLDGCMVVEGSTPFAFSPKPAEEGVWADYFAISTKVGWVTPVGYIWTKKIGKTVFVQYKLTGVSNSTVTSFTVPYTISMPSNSMAFGRTYDTASRIAIIDITNGGGAIILLNKDMDGSSFAATGDKYSYGQFFYEAAN